MSVARIGAFAVALCLAGSTPQLHAADDGYGVLQKNCFTCHGAAKTSGLDLRTQESALAGGMHGSVLTPSDPEQSRLYKLVTHVAEPSMPPGKKLTDDEIEAIRIWIEAGAMYPKIDSKQAAATDAAM